MNYQERIERLSKMVAEGRITRGEWGRDEDRTCLLAALSPEVRAARSSSYCPSSVMPAWLAHLTPKMDDNGTAQAWSAFVRRYAAIAGRWHVLTKYDWRAADYAVRALCVQEARIHIQDASGPDIFRDVMLCRRWDRATQDWAAAWAAEAAGAAAGAAGAVAWDRLNDGILTILEQACAKAEYRK